MDRLTIRHSQLDTQIGIGNAEPTETLQVEGNISGSGNLDIVSITGSKLVSISGSLTSTSSFGDGRIFRSLRIGAASSSANENYALHISESHGFARGIKVETKGSADSNSQVLIEGNTGGGSPGIATALELKSNIDFRARGIIHSTATGSEAERWFAGVPYTGAGYQIGFSDAASNNLPHYKVSSSLFIKEDGAVGIGTTVPTNQLEVEGNISSSGDIQQNSTATGSFGRIEAAGNLNVAGGKVGIGTTSPPQALSVVGNILLQPDAENDSFLHANNDLAISSDASIIIAADTNDTSGVAASDIIFGAGSAVDTNGNKDFTFADAYPSVVPRLEAMRIKGDTQNVGIGTTSPTAALQVEGVISASGGISSSGNI